MDADTILRIKPGLTEYLHRFDDCFGRVTVRRHLDTYVLGQLSDLERKSVEPMADAAGTPPRDLQQFLGLYRWDESAMRDTLAPRRTLFEVLGRVDQPSVAYHPTTLRQGQRQSSQANSPAFTGDRPAPERPTPLQLASYVAL